VRDHTQLFHGIVESNQDPKNQRRLTVRVPDVLGQTVSDWARPGSVVDSPLPAGERVWVQFPNGDLRYPVYYVPNDPKHGRIVPTKDNLTVHGPDGETKVVLGKSSAQLLGPGGGSGAVADGDLHARGTGGYTNMYALDFIETSDISQKQDVGPVPFDSIEVIRNAPAYSYRYKNSGHKSIGPMRHELPELTRMGQHHVSQGALIGILWDAVGTLSRQVEELQAELRTIKENAEIATLE